MKFFSSLDLVLAHIFFFEKWLVCSYFESKYFFSMSTFCIQKLFICVLCKPLLFSVVYFIPKLKAWDRKFPFLLCFVIFICTNLKKNSSVYINFLTGLDMWILSFLFLPILTFPVCYLWSIRSIVVFNLLWKLKATILFRFLMF